MKRNSLQPVLASALLATSLLTATAYAGVVAPTVGKSSSQHTCEILMGKNTPLAEQKCSTNQPAPIEHPVPVQIDEIDSPVAFFMTHKNAEVTLAQGGIGAFWPLCRNIWECRDKPKEKKK